jgi:chromosome segregation ATPase
MMKTGKMSFFTGLEKRIKELENSLKEKDVLLSSTKGSLAEARTQNEKLSKELKGAHIRLKENSSWFSRESKALNMTIKAEAEKNLKLSGTLKALRDKCFGFATQCTARLKISSILSELCLKKPTFMPKFKVNG